MDVIVQKYGGSSVATFERLETVADEIAASRRAGASVVVVVSAMGGSTDELVEMGRRAWNSQGALADRPAQPPARELDMLVSTGERITMTLLSIMLQARGLDAISFTGSQSGIVTTERHFDARIVEVRPFRIQEQLEQDKIVIVAGFQGVSREKEVTTLGRGGSDTSAVALAAALGATSCEVCSDVDGVYSADPRHIDAAVHLPHVSYEHILEMAESGAKVLHSEAIRHAERHSVKILARRTGDRLKNEARETAVTKSVDAPEGAVVADDSILVVHTDASHIDKVVGALDTLDLRPWDVFGGRRGSDRSRLLANGAREGRCQSRLSRGGTWRASQRLRRRREKLEVGEFGGAQSSGLGRHPGSSRRRAARCSRTPGAPYNANHAPASGR